MNQTHVLVIDDEPAVRKVGRKTLRQSERDRQAFQQLFLAKDAHLQQSRA